MVFFAKIQSAVCQLIRVGQQHLNPQDGKNSCKQEKQLKKSSFFRKVICLKSMFTL